MGKVFGFMEAVDTLAPLTASTAYTKVFTYTMNTLPGLIFQIMAGFIIISIISLIWIDLFAVKNSNSNQPTQNGQSNADGQSNTGGQSNTVVSGQSIAVISGQENIKHRYKTEKKAVQTDHRTKESQL